MEESRLTDSVAVVTGAGRNVGKGIARRLASEGAHVVIADIDETSAEATAVEIHDDGGSAAGVQVDVSKEIDVQTMVQQIDDEYGRLDVLVNNAAVKEEAEFLDMETEMFDRTIAVNLRGLFLCTRECGRLMRDVGNGGVVLNVSSTSGHKAEPTSLAYGTTKGAILNFTRSAAAALAPHDVRVITLTPTRTGKRTQPSDEYNREGLAEDDLSDQDIIDDIPLGRLGRPSDLGDAAVFLASNEAEFITGTELRVNGGRSV